MKRSLLSLPRLALAGFSLLTASAWAGTFSADFESGLPAGSTVYGNAFVDTSGGVDNNGGVLKLTVATGNQQGAFIINDLDPGLRVGSFLATFKLQLGGGSASPADGFSFNFGAGLSGGMNEEGSGTGITVTFDTFDNGTGDAQEGPEIRVKNNGSIVASRKMIGEFKTGANYVDVLLRYNISGTMDIVFNHQVMFTNLYVSGTPAAGSQFGFGARTGGNTENHFIDNLNITTVPAGNFYLKGGTLPSQPLTATPDATFQTSLNDLGAAVLTNGISLYFNNELVSPTVSKPGGITTITYDPPGWLLAGSSNNLTVIVHDSSGGTPATLSYNFNVTNGPYWSLAPGSRSYLTIGGSTPAQRSLGFNTLSNHLYLIDRSAGLAIYVLDATTGADLYQLNTTGISGGAIVLLGLAVADDGAIYAANEVTANASTAPLKIYRWANANPSTTPALIYSGDPGAPGHTGFRWGDTLAAHGSGAGTQLIMDCQNQMFSALFAPTDGTLAAFTNATLSHAYTGTIIGRGLQFGSGNTYWLKKKSNGGGTQFPLDLIQINPDLSTTILTSVPDFHTQFGTMSVDLSKNMGAGLFFATNTVSSYDRLVVYDLSTVTNPLQIATYNFPTNHQANANFLGQVVFGPDKIFALDANNGLMAVPALAPAPPTLTIKPSGSNVILSWPNAVPGFVLQGTGDAGVSGWTTLNLPLTTNLTGYSATAATSTNVIYRLIK